MCGLTRLVLAEIRVPPRPNPKIAELGTLLISCATTAAIPLNETLWRRQGLFGVNIPCVQSAMGERECALNKVGLEAREQISVSEPPIHQPIHQDQQLPRHHLVGQSLVRYQ